MADTKKNALEELAKRLDIIAFGLVTDGHPCDETIDIRKAQRIVEEVSKVEDVNDVYQLKLVKRPNQCQSIDSIVKCRAIAEEGAK